MSSPCGPRSTLEQRRSRRRDGHAENRTRAYQADRASLPQPGALTAASLSDSHQPRLCERGQIDLGHLTNPSPYQFTPLACALLTSATHSSTMSQPNANSSGAGALGALRTLTRRPLVVVLEDLEVCLLYT